MAAGHGIQKTADTLFLSPNTVKNHRASIKAALDVRNVVWATTLYYAVFDEKDELVGESIPLESSILL